MAITPVHWEYNYNDAQPTYTAVYPRQDISWTTASANFSTAVQNLTTATATASTQWAEMANNIWPKWVASTNSATIDWHFESEVDYTRVWNGWIADDAEREAYEARLVVQRDELQARREARSREALANRQALMEQAVTARSVAMGLLDSLLTPDEAEFKRRYGKIEIFGSDGCLYWIELHRETVHGNIVKVDEHGCRLGRACVAPAMYDRDSGNTLPTADGWVGQYLGLKFDAQAFLSHANWSQVYRCTEAAA